MQFSFNFLGEIIGGETYISRPKEIEEITWMELYQGQKKSKRLLDGITYSSTVFTHTRTFTIFITKERNSTLFFNGTIVHQSS